MDGAGNMQSIGVGIGWNSNLICGDMSITTTLQNQLNGITNGFQTIMSNVIQNATSAVASLPALIIQRADPGLYNLLTNGILQARLDFDRSKMTRSEEHTSELQSPMRISYAVFCLKKKNQVRMTKTTKRQNEI